MKREVAYVGCYTFHGRSKGIEVFDVDSEAGRFTRREHVTVDNCAYLTVSKDSRFLYAAVDEGISAFQIMPEGDLAFLKTTSIRGMRGCYLDIHPSGKFIAIGGYHDGKMTVLRIEKDGTVGDITYEFYDKGIGSVAERNFRPHISCTEFSPDGKLLLAVDSGIDQVKVFLFDETTGQAVMKDMVHCGINSGPHRLKFYQYGRIVYILHELQNYVGVYDCTYNEKGLPTFELKQKIATLPKNYTVPSAACVIDFSPDFKHLICANAGENTIALYDIDEETGLLTLRNILPVSGDYPKDIDIFPNGRFLVSTNHDSDSLTFFRIHYDTGTIVMNGLELPIDNPNCLRIVELPE
ncbi:MAG: lactonase family protein [Lachnospiraceae bacterium]|nr:lactonase family protein [Lachnospiraceae bacterium]